MTIHSGILIIILAFILPKSGNGIVESLEICEWFCGEGSELRFHQSAMYNHKSTVLFNEFRFNTGKPVSSSVFSKIRLNENGSFTYITFNDWGIWEISAGFWAKEKDSLIIFNTDVSQICKYMDETEYIMMARVFGPSLENFDNAKFRGNGNCICL